MGQVFGCLASSEPPVLNREAEAAYKLPMGPRVGSGREANPVVFLDVDINGVNLGIIEIELRADVVPKVMPIAQGFARKRQSLPLSWAQRRHPRPLTDPPLHPMLPIGRRRRRTSAPSAPARRALATREAHFTALSRTSCAKEVSSKRAGLLQACCRLASCYLVTFASLV